MSKKKRVLVLCTANSARSQMAEGLLQYICTNEYEICSAGTMASRVRPEAIEALREIGIDISGNRSKSVEEFSGSEIDYVLTVCDYAKETCPYFPVGTKLVHHSFEDPAAAEGGWEQRLEAFRRVRDQIREYLETDFLEILR